MQCPTPISIKHPNSQGAHQRLAVPCGKCGACQQSRRSDWTFRLKWEEKNAKSSFFITLTYSDENLPLGENLIPSLHKYDLQTWLKRARKSVKLRYYCVGEYGTETQRPHYHGLIFLQDELTKKEFYLILKSTWTQGNIHIGSVTESSIHYCSKFHITVNKNESDTLGRMPEFATMSLKPAIGHIYLDKNKNFHIPNNDELRDFIVNNGFKQRIPRYYRLKLFSEVQRAKLNNEMQWRQNEAVNKEKEFDKKHGSGSYYQALLQKAKNFRRKIKPDRF